MSLEQNLAILGATTGTAALLWNILRDVLSWHYNKPKLQILAIFGSNTVSDDSIEKHVLVEIENTGGRSVSAYSFGMKTWKSKLDYLLSAKPIFNQSLSIKEISLDGQNAWKANSIFLKDSNLLSSGAYRLFVASMPDICPYKAYSRIYVWHTPNRKVISCFIHDKFSKSSAT